MRIIRLFFLLLALSGFNAKAEVTVQFGNGNNTSTQKGPWHQMFSNNRSKKVMLFSQAELAAQGILPGVVINAMKWHKANNSQFINGASAVGTLYIRSANYPSGYGNSSYNVLSYTGSGFAEVSTVNYNTGSSNIGMADWVGFTDFYFTYTGGDLEVYVDWQTTTGFGNVTTNGGFSWHYSNTNYNQYLGYNGTPYTNSDFLVDNDRPNTLMVFTMSNCTDTPTAGEAVSDAQGVLCQGQNFGLTLVNNSISTQQSYTWQHSDSANGPWLDYSVALQQPLIGIAAPAHTKWYRAKVNCGGLVAYSTPVQVLVNPGLSAGTYTIDNSQPTGNGNFQSFHDAIVALGCGITGPVTLDVVAGSGPYNEQIVIPQIGGASPLTPVTINGNGATIQHTSSDPGERATIKLDGADNIKINDLNIVVTGATGFDYGYGVHIIHDANQNTINDCHITINTLPGSEGSDAYAGLVINGHAQEPLGINFSSCDGNIITNNSISGGYYGIVLMGNSESSTITGNVISKNEVHDFYAYGIYAGFNSIALIEGNDISRPDRYDDLEGDFTGIMLSGYNASTVLMSNKIHHPFNAMQGSVHAAIAISITDCNPGEGSEVLVANNVIYEFRNRGSQFGLKADGAGYVKFQHNTIALDYEDATCDSCGVYGFYQSGSDIANLDFSNNIISLDGFAVGKLSAMYFSSGVNSSTFNNNNYYIAPAVSVAASIGAVNGVEFDNILLWKLVVMGDLLSVSIKPDYQNPGAGNMRPANPALDNKGLQVGILFDVTGALRNLATPDIGAYEFDENTLAISNINSRPEGLNIYPNPASGVVNVSYSEKVTIAVSGLDGRVLLHAAAADHIDMSALAPGLYIIKVVDKEGEILATEKILKQDK